MKYQKNSTVFFLISLVLLSGCISHPPAKESSSQPKVHEANPELKVYEATAEVPEIGKASHHDRAAKQTLRVDIPVGAQIQSIKAYFAYLPWGQGQSAYDPTWYVESPIIGLDGQGYAEWPHSWARAYLVSKGSTSNSQHVIVRFESWKHDNSRKGKLEVKYTLPKG